ncbi:MAG TPA: carboxymuconolactone decarboxylase family protein [Acidimicrobiia bacterium]
MPRVRLIEERTDASPDQLETFDHIAASRGTMIRPFAAMLHRPEIARATADLGAVIRYQSTLTDRDRELVICVTAIERDCGFEWDSHSPIARAAGVPEATLDAIRQRGEVSDEADAALVAFVRELSRGGKVDNATFDAMRSRLGDPGVVELSAVVGYYTMMAVFMSACEAC